MDKKFIIAVIVIFVVSNILGFITHGWALSDEYMATGLYRTEAEQEANFGWMMLAHLLMSIAFVGLYRGGIQDKPWLGQGIRFGLWIAVFGAIAVYMMYYAVLPTPEMLALRQGIYDTINLVIMGVVVAWLYR